MNFLLDFAHRKMMELRIKKYDTSTRLVEISALSSEHVSAHNDFMFFANVYSGGSNPINGSVIGENMGMDLNPSVAQTYFHKHSFYFTGDIKITNKDASDKLYLEFLVITPLKD